MERGFVLTVVLLLAVAMFAGNFDSNPTGMQPIGFEFDDEGKTVKNNVLETPEKTLIARLV